MGFKMMGSTGYSDAGQEKENITRHQKIGTTRRLKPIILLYLNHIPGNTGQI